MNDRCSQATLELALAGQLADAEESQLNRHLEQCSACTVELERLSGGERASDEIGSYLRRDEIDDESPSRDECSNSDFVVHHLEPSDDPEVLGQLGGYDVVEVIGRGGMGIVLKGYDRELKRYVAIKALAPHLAHSPLARKRFAREAQAAAAVVNLHVVAIYQVQPLGKLPFLVMPLLTGETLAQRIKNRGLLELAEVLRVGMQAADGLAAAHAQGLVHRDIKPANIFLEKGVERAVLTDFGLARAADDVSMTRQGVIAGTPEYMSPEQARGEPLDGRSDLFGLGCVLYEMATGVSPFRTDSTLATLRRIVDERPAAMTSLVPELPPWFCHLVERLLSKDPHQRFASANEVRLLMEECLSHLRQPTKNPLPVSLTRLDDERTATSQGATNAMRSSDSAYLEAARLVWQVFGNMLLGRSIDVEGRLLRFDADSNSATAGAMPPGSTPTRVVRTEMSPWKGIIWLPVWFLCLVTPIQILIDLMNLVPTSKVELQNSSFVLIIRVLVYTFEAVLFGLIAAQFSVAVIPKRWLRPLVALWILVLPYLLARTISDLLMNQLKQTFSLLPTKLTSDVIGAYLLLAIISAIAYSLILRRPEKSLP